MIKKGEKKKKEKILIITIAKRTYKAVFFKRHPNRVGKYVFLTSVL